MKTSGLFTKGTRLLKKFTKLSFLHINLKVFYLIGDGLFTKLIKMGAKSSLIIYKEKKLPVRIRKEKVVVAEVQLFGCTFLR